MPKIRGEVVDIFLETIHYALRESFYCKKWLKFKFFAWVHLLIFLSHSSFASSKEHFHDAGRISEYDRQSVAVRLHNIGFMQNVLKDGLYCGYDIIIVSSTMQEEANYQQKILEKAFEGTTKSNGRAPIILSVVDLTDGGQLIGSVFTWLMAEKKMREKYPHLMEGCFNFLDYVRKTGSKVAVFHNGGRGERTSPLTQSLGNSRGSQKLVGFVKNACGEVLELEVLLGVILQCSSFASTNEATHIDTFWTSQIAFGSHPHDRLSRSNFSLDKFLVGFDKKNLNAQNITDFGTAALSLNGRMMAFYGNKRFAGRKGSRYVIDLEKIERELLAKGDRVAYDFGSFSTSLDMWQLLIDYWCEKASFKDVLMHGRASKIKRDIDPHFIQPLVRLLYGINDIADRRFIDEQLPLPSDLKNQTDFDRALEEFARIVKSVSPQAYFYIWEEIEAEADLKKRAEGRSTMEEAIEFYLSYRQTPAFKDLEKVFGFIDLGEETQWFRYRRPIDILNEKLEMLTDMMGRIAQVHLNGEVCESHASRASLHRAAEGRLMRGIADDAIARFTVDGKAVSLPLSAIKKGVSFEGVYIKNSIVQNCDFTPGSSIINSIANNVVGKVIANYSYLESTTSPLIEVYASIIHEAIDMKFIEADREVVSDVYRTRLHPPYHGRMRAPIGFDPKGMPIYKCDKKNEELEMSDADLDEAIGYFVVRIPYDLMNAKFFSDETARTDDGLFTFEGIRRIAPFRIADKYFKETVNQIAKEAVLDDRLRRQTD